MRGGRSLLLLMAVALGLGAYIYFVESERDPAATDAKEKVFTIDRTAVTELKIKSSSSSETTTLRRTGDAWEVVAPVVAPADSATVDAILSTLETVEVDRVLDENPSALAQFGLEVPAVEVTATAGGTAHSLALGIDTPTGTGLYARANGSPRLLLVPSFHKAALDKSTFDLRNRQALAVNRDTVDRVTLAPRGAPPIELHRDGVNWQLSVPVTARADFSPTDGLIGRLATAQMSSIVLEGSEPTPAQLRTYGLDSPQLTASIGTGSSMATLALGAAKDDASIYARDLSRPIIFTVDASLLTDLRKEPADLRVRDIFEFNAFSAMTLDVAHGTTAVAFAKSTTVPSGTDAAAMSTWTRTRPTTGDVNQTALTDLLNAVSSLRAEQFVSQVPATGDTVEVTVQFGTPDAAREERATLRRSGSTAYAIRPGEPGAAVIAADGFDAVLASLKTLTTSAQ